MNDGLTAKGGPLAGEGGRAAVCADPRPVRSLRRPAA